MGRPERPLDPQAGPLERFAHQLRELREEAGKPTYDVLARKTGYAKTTLSTATRGQQMPSLEVTLAFVQACGGDLPTWEQRWHQVNAALTPPAPQPAEPPLPPEPTADSPNAPRPPRRTPRGIWYLAAAAAAIAAAAITGALMHRGAPTANGVPLAGISTPTPVLTGSASPISAASSADPAPPSSAASSGGPGTPVSAAPSGAGTGDAGAGVSQASSSAATRPAEVTRPATVGASTRAPAQVPTGGSAAPTPTHTDKAPTYNCGSGADGWGCQGKDPYQAGCDKGAYLVKSAPGIRAGQTIGVIELWYSERCGTNWAIQRIYQGDHYRTLTSADNGQARKCYPDDCTSLYDGPGSPWTDMVYGANIPVTVTGTWVTDNGTRYTATLTL